MVDTKKLKADNDLMLFDEVFKVIVDDLTSDDMNSSEIGDAMKWYKEVCEYNCPFGKKNRGLTVVHSYKYLLGDKVTEEDLKLARILGWCVEFLQAFFLIADDIMDASVTRRGQPCWYKKEKVGLIAVNDALYIENAIYVILRKYFRTKPYYVHLVELFHDCTMKTVTGQTLDLITAPVNRLNFDNFTIDRYNAIVKYKTAFYSFYLPVALAMYMAGIEDDESHNSARSILLIMGEFFQIQDDVIDCFGDPKLTGKIGTDIEDNKCGWLIVQALKHASPQQRMELRDNYAQNDPVKVEQVKAIYRDLDLPKLFADYEENSYNELVRSIDTMSKTLPKEMFIAYGQKIYKREK